MTVVEGTIGNVPPVDGQHLDGTTPAGCAHPVQDRRLVDGLQVCTACGDTVEAALPGVMPRDRPGGVDPTQRPTDRSAGGLRHITYDSDAPMASRPYTPDEVERELVDTLDRIERGAGWLTTEEEKRGAAKLAYELEYAKALWRSDGRSAEQRAAEALIACEQLYVDWQRLELTCKTAREGMHNLRTKLSGLQTVARSVGDALRGAR